MPMRTLWTGYVWQMSPLDSPRRAMRLREVAEQLLLLASGADQATHDRLVMHAGELLRQAQELEGPFDTAQSQTPDLPIPSPLRH